MRILSIYLSNLKCAIAERRKSQKLKASSEQCIEEILQKWRICPVLLEGVPYIHYSNGVVCLDGKGGQKLESFLKLESILGEDFHLIFSKDSSKAKDEHELFFVAKQFTLFAFARKLTEEQLNLMSSLATDLQRLYVKIAPKVIDVLGKEGTVKNAEVFAKLHHIGHYSSQFRLWGNLHRCCTFRWERHHRFSKQVARNMFSFKNTAKTIHTKHQVHRARYEQEIHFNSKDFFPKEDGSRYSRIFHHTELEVENRRLLLVNDGDAPFPTNRNIIKTIIGSRDVWFKADQCFRLSPSNDLYLSGQVCRLKKNKEDSKGKILPKSRTAELKELEIGEYGLIDVRGLDFGKDFVTTKKISIHIDGHNHELTTYLLQSWILN